MESQRWLWPAVHAATAEIATTTATTTTLEQVVTTDNSGTGDSPRQTTIIVAVSSLSMAGCLFIIMSYVLWPDIRTRTRQLLVFLSLADFMNSAGNAAGAACAQWCVAGAMKTGTLNCQLQAFVTTYSSLCSFAWTVSIAIFLYWMFSSGDVVLGERRIVSLHIFSWGLPLAITLAAQFGDALGNDDSLDSSGWCWVRRHPGTPHFAPSPRAGVDPMFEDRRARTFWLLMGGKGWELLAYVFTTLFYLAIKCHVYGETHHGRQNLLTSAGLATAQKIDRRLIFVPIMFVLLRIWGTVRTLLDIADSGAHPESWFHSSTLRLLHGIGDNLPGFFNFIIFCCFSPKVRSKFRTCCSLGSGTSRRRTLLANRPASPGERASLLESGSVNARVRTSITASGRFTPEPSRNSGVMVARMKNPVSARASPYAAPGGSISSASSMAIAPAQISP